jgi:hypothetical protein
MALGDELHRIVANFRGVLQVVTRNTRVVKERDLRRKLFDAENALNALRSALDDQLCRDHEPQYCPHVYYPGGGGDRSEHARTCDTCVT